MDLDKDILLKINEALKPLDDAHTSELDAPQWPVTFLLEAGRSGSTFLSQLLLSCYRVGYVSNVLGKFWLAPYVGAIIEKELLTGEPAQSDLQSSFGNTSGAGEPNEWGWFWRHWLKLDGNVLHIEEPEQIDFQGLSQKLAAMEEAKNCSLFFDNSMTTANINILKKNLPSALAVELKRDPYFICNSHLNARIDRYGDVHQWYGYRPRNFLELSRIEDPVEQVVSQVKATLDEIQDGLRAFEPDEVLTLNYREVCDDPKSQISRIKLFMEKHGGPVHPLKEIELPAVVNRDNVELVRPEFKENLDFYTAEIFGSEIKLAE